MNDSFQQYPDETILFRSSPNRKWYALAWGIGLEFLEVGLLVLFSFTALTSLTFSILVKVLPANIADLTGRILFQDVAPILIIAWFIEDTARIFTSEFILTNQRIWTKGAPYAWSRGRETDLSAIESMSSRRGALFIHLKNNKKAEVHLLPDAKEIVKSFKQFSVKSNSD